MTRCVRITSFNRFDHYLEEFLPTFLELMVEAVYVTDRYDRNDYSN